MKDVFVHETATVETKNIGSGTKIWHYAHVREGASIGKNCTIGHCAYIGKNVKVGDNVKIENKASLFQGVTLEDDVFIGPHVAFTNDLRPRSEGKWVPEKTVVKTGASIGVNSTVLCGLTIGKYAMIGGGSVVTKDIPGHGMVFGNPARLRGFVCECGEMCEKNDERDGIVLMVCRECNKPLKIPINVYNEARGV